MRRSRLRARPDPDPSAGAELVEEIIANATVLATAPGAKLSATIAAFSAALQRR